MFRPGTNEPSRVTAVILAFLLALPLAGALFAQTPAQQPQPQQPTQQQPQQPQVPEAGGPTGGVGPIAVPKKTGEDKDKPVPAPPRPAKREDLPQFAITVDVPLVTVAVSVVTDKGDFVPGLKPENFRIFEDGVPQKISKVEQSEAPITAVLLVEFANTHYQFMYDALNASYAFANSLKPQDWLAIISFDMRTYIMTDFTQDKRVIYAALGQLRVPGFSETNVFDALYDTLDRVATIDGRKYIVLVASGRDTFSRITYDKILKKVQATPNVTIHTIATGDALIARYSGSLPGTVELDYLQAKNQMATFARMTGGRYYAPRFEAEFPEIFADIGSVIRNQYTISYKPTNARQDGTFRKLKVELQAPDGGKLKVVNEKGKEMKYKILAREGYTAKHEVE